MPGTVVSVTLALAAGVLVHAGDQGNDGRNKPRFTFALWGDAMYTTADFAKLPALIADINASKAAFSIYDGDIKSGGSKCIDDVYQPLVSQANLIPNLTRVQTFGSPNINWVEVTVEPKDRALFTMQPMIVQ